MAWEDDADPIHPHCINCVSITKCSARSEKRASCPIVHCKLDCGASFHACKGDEHLLLCPNVKVPCANAINGCPVWLLRGQVGGHLEHCPASLVYCTAEWNRWGWRRGATSATQCVDHSSDQLQLDFALAMRDLRLLAAVRSGGGGRHHRQSGKKLCWGGGRNDRMPVALAPRDVGAGLNALCINNGSCGDDDAAGDHEGCMLNGHTNRSGGPLLGTKSNAEEGEDKVACNDADLCLMRAAGACYAARPGVPLNIELCVEFLTHYQLKPDRVYTFACGQVFRRDEYAWHYQNVHRDIHCGLNGWLEQRCPLAQYGCSFSQRRFRPAPPGSQLVFSELLESFGLTFPSPLAGEAPPPSEKQVAKREGSQSHLPNGHSHTKGSSRKSADMEVSTGPAFSDLPFEVLQHIATFLDAFSLNNFSMVSKRLRDVSCSLLESRGMVVFNWERRGKRCWGLHSKSWYFSNGFSPIRQWLFSDEEHMSSHLKECRFFDRNIKKVPTAVCFGNGDSRGPKTLLHLAM